MTPLNLQMIASAGGSVEVNAANYTALNLQMIANAGKNKGAEVILYIYSAGGSVPLRLPLY